MYKFLIANPYNDNDINLYKEFDKMYQTANVATLLEFKKNLTEEEYKNSSIKSNEIKQLIYIIENGKIKESCFLYGEKDLKRCNLLLVPVNRSHEAFLEYIKEYTFKVLGMEELFISTSLTDKALIKNLTGSVCLGENNGNLNFVIEASEEEKKSTEGFKI